MEARQSELRGWGERLVADDDEARRAAGRAILMLLDELARVEGERDAALQSASRARAAVDAARREAARQDTAEIQTQGSWADRVRRRIERR